MTEYNRLFADAFDRITPASDDADFIRGIIERADKMEKENKNTSVYRVESRPGDQIQYKPRKAPIIAGVAAVTAAAAGIGFFAGGGSFGNFEFVPLKEGGGAGYSANAEAAGEVTTNALLETLVEPEVTDHYMRDDYYEFENYMVHITGYEFNTVFLRLYYDVRPKLGVDPIDIENDRPFIWSSGSDYTVIAYRQNASSEDTVSYMVDIIPTEPTHKLDVRFEAAETGETALYTAECGNWNYVFRIPCDVEGADPRVSELFISVSEVIMKYSLSDSNEPLPSVEVYNTANIPVSFADSSFNAADMTNNVGYAFRGFAEPCDTSDIGRVYLGNVLVYEREGMLSGGAAETSAYAVDDMPEGYATTGTAAWDDTMPQPANGAEATSVAELLNFSSRTVRMEGYRYDGHILAAELVGEADLVNGKTLAFRSVSDPRTLIQGCVQEDGGTYKLWALLDIPEGQTDTIQIVEIPPASDGIEVGTTITIEGTMSASPGIVLDSDMSGYGLPGVTLESMRLSTYGLELMFSCENINDTHELNVDIMFGNEMVPIKELNSVVLYDETDGLYHACTVVAAENMFGCDLTAASRVSVNGLTVRGDEFTPGGADERRGIYDIMPRRSWELE